MLIKRPKGWELPERLVTPESVYLNRRALLRGLGIGTVLAGSGALAACGDEASADNETVQLADLPPDPSAGLYPVKRNERYTVDRPITEEKMATTYNNFYEFGSSKNIWREAQDLPIRPWTVTFDGMVEQERTVAIDDLLAAMPLEERVYRHRCVEAWSMTVPWSGFALKSLVEYAKPLSSAKYLVMQTFQNSDIAPGQKQVWYPWPYVEGLTIEEATNELAFIATGLYGKPIPRQNGAPLRLAVPWKYGFKSVKSIVRFTFTDKRPVSFWEELQASEYGFWANVNPEVSHPRWSQASERVLGTGDMVPTLLYNGYEEFVGDLYKGLEGESLYM
ncbi:protein-methionine-sulfoxide reductase catalytic subunit MsrP [Thalassobaculum sp. OXR-137]|uniref:protein-methionine-sulfoxide reductase catalytic subunit MsrP n=1 Tax=Thalassobaculum sp. OXR-137 TaxID=3100173 RepID=UPI002AC8B34D|nr:protein-methionine-sulfoxide reductase catalytic subunit MsrP [Thalassobaculum sp. OXR-137]WPZ36774.1 protein-methionine-sulfoxide reductase catalytic subunit MsrP [Thalassobaculum sp. OXR-137]